jgi:hypothetical protein
VKWESFASLLKKGGVAERLTFGYGTSHALERGGDGLVFRFHRSIPEAFRHREARSAAAIQIGLPRFARNDEETLVEKSSARNKR